MTGRSVVHVVRIRCFATWNRAYGHVGHRCIVGGEVKGAYSERRFSSSRNCEPVCEIESILTISAPIGGAVEVDRAHVGQCRSLSTYLIGMVEGGIVRISDFGHFGSGVVTLRIDEHIAIAIVVHAFSTAAAVVPV